MGTNLVPQYWRKVSWTVRRTLRRHNACLIIIIICVFVPPFHPIILRPCLSSLLLGRAAISVSSPGYSLIYIYLFMSWSCSNPHRALVLAFALTVYDSPYLPSYFSNRGILYLYILIFMKTRPSSPYLCILLLGQENANKK